MRDRDAVAVVRPLAKLNGARPDAPPWYGALQLEPEEVLSVEVDGASIEVLGWGERGRPGVLLAHGSRAHARWWGPVAPLLAQDYRVVSLSCAGMGGSQWRAAYTIAQQVQELFAAAYVGGLFEGPAAPVFVGHSFGARAMAQAMSERGSELSGTVLVDSAVMPNRWPKDSIKTSDPRYDSISAALSRFNLRPSQECENLFILHDVAIAGLEEVVDGWRWRFDPEYYRKFVISDVWPAIARPQCRLAFVYGENSVTVTPAELAAQREQVPAGTPFIGIPAAGHHIMFDQPIAVTVALRSLIESWLNA